MFDANCNIYAANRFVVGALGTGKRNDAYAGKLSRSALANFRLQNNFHLDLDASNGADHDWRLTDVKRMPTSISENSFFPIVLNEANCTISNILANEWRGKIKWEKNRREIDTKINRIYTNALYVIVGSIRESM